MAPTYEAAVVEADPIPEFEEASDKILYQAGGDAPDEILQELLGCDYDVAEVLRGALSRATLHSVADGGDDYYSSEQFNYSLAIPYSPKYDEAWAEFESSVKYRGRFFNREEERFLEELLRPFIVGELNGGTPPFIEAGPRSAIRFVYRARQANDVAKRKAIFESPRHELAPPSPRLRRQGRMNAVGIRAFYGSSDVETCVAEIRVPVGGKAIVGKFEFLRSLNLLDFRKVETATPPGNISWFHTNFAEQHAYVRFMRSLHELIRRPVLPDAEAFDYLPTQILAEFLTTHTTFHVDGILMGSSLTSSRSTDEERTTNAVVFNVALFADAAIVEGSDFTSDFTVVGIEESSAVNTSDEYVANDERVYFREGEPVKVPIERETFELGATEPSLRLLIDELRVVHVRGIKYDIAERDVKYRDDSKDYTPY